MSMMWDRKKSLTSILDNRKLSKGKSDGPSKPDPLPKPEEREEPSALDFHRMVAKEVMNSIHAGDADRFHDAMTAYFDLHMNKSNDDKPEPKK